MISSVLMGSLNLFHLSIDYGFYLCDKQGYCNRVLDFFPVSSFRHNGHIVKSAWLLGCLKLI